MNTLKLYLAVGLAGSLGSMLRLLVGKISGHLFGTSFPVGTLIINLTGSLFLGWFLTIVGDKAEISPIFKLAVATGFVGAYTTFSTFMYESDKLLEAGSQIKAGANLILSLVLGLVAVRLGTYMARRF